MALKEIKLSNKEKNKYLKDINFYAGDGEKPQLLIFFKDDKRNLAVLYEIRKEDGWCRIFLFYKDLSIGFELLRVYDDSSIPDEEEEFFHRVEIKVANLLIPSNLKIKTNEIKQVIHRSLSTIYLEDAKFFDTLLDRVSYYMFEFQSVNYGCGKWGIKDPKLFVLLGYGPGQKEGKRFDPNDEKFINFIAGERLEDQLYLFTIEYDHLIVDFYASYHKTDRGAFYQVEKVLIPAEYKKHKKLLIDLIPRALLHFSNVEDKIKASKIKMNDFEFILANPRNPKFAI
ncbi:MAG: hypothetical protein LBE31_05070 [Deltaproteobacteria bacterium]|jgi:hypothetical protein|nr:hypothetical protein [Deltaproteobacteria bacterium]